MAPMALQNLLLALLLLLLSCHLSWAISKPSTTIRFVDRTYRKYVGKQDKEHPWHNAGDILIKRGFSMVAVEGIPSDEPVTSISTPLGPVGLTATTPFILQDFHVTYDIPTPWPYCESLSKCLVLSQADSPVAKAPVIIDLPAGVSAVDLYIDAAIDCVTVLRAVVTCKVRATGASGRSVAVKVSVSSICDSPFVGKYIAFFDEVEHIKSLSISCKSTYPNALGLIRIGTRQQEK